METLITLGSGPQDGALAGPARTGIGHNPTRGGALLTGAAMRRWLRQAYGICKLLSAPREALSLARVPPGTALAGHLTAYPQISTLAAQPFVCCKWSTGTRLRRIIEHCAIIDALGQPFAINSRQFVEVVAFELDGSKCRLTLDKAEWLASDGLLSASLWADDNRVFSISFCLSDHRGARTAYIGGIQGRRDAGALDQNRALTKAAHGMRPRDLAFELFRMLIPRLGVTQLRCVADANRYQKTWRARLPISVNDTVQLDYDEMWTSRGGVLGQDGFFLVPGERQRREVADIPTKKRSMYARRYAFLEQLNEAVASALKSELPIQSHFGIHESP